MADLYPYDSRYQQSSASLDNDNDAPPSPIKTADHQQKLETKPQATFLTKLYALLERPENHHMIRWDPAGEHIIVERPEQFALHVLPGVYRQSRFASFSRQLNIYGFMRKVNLRNVDPAIDDPDASTWSHPTLNRHSPPEVVANFKRRVPPRLPKPRKRDGQDHASMPPRTAMGIGSVLITGPSSVSDHNKLSSAGSGRARPFSIPSTLAPRSQGITRDSTSPTLHSTEDPSSSNFYSRSTSFPGSSEPDKSYEPWDWRPRDPAEDNQQASSPRPTHQPIWGTDGLEYFPTGRELRPTFSGNIFRMPGHDRAHSSGLYPLPPSHNSFRDLRSPSLRTRSNSIPRSFSGRHEQSYDSQTALTQQFVEGFAKVLQGGDLSEEDHQKYLELKDGAVQAATTYRRAISDYKDTGSLNLIGKVNKMGQVRKHKRRLREANADLQDHYYSSATDGSDASSIAAQSGSPPSSGLVAENILEWRDSVPDPTSEQQSIHVEHDDETPHPRIARVPIVSPFIPDDDAFRQKSIVVYNDNRIITKNINSGNTNHKRISDSYNSVTHSGVNLESCEAVSPMDMSP